MFRISCGGQSLFVGQTYTFRGAAAIDTPVLHMVRDAEEHVVLYLGAYEKAWAGMLAAGQTEQRQRLDRPELQAALCERGALRVLAPDAQPLEP